MGGPPRPGPLPPSTSATHEYRLDRATNKDDHSHDPQRRRAVADIRSETPAGFGSEQVAGFILECMAGFVGIRSLLQVRLYFSIMLCSTMVLMHSTTRPMTHEHCGFDFGGCLGDNSRK